MKIGPYTIHSLETGTFALDGGAMFGVVPWVFWRKTNPPDERNRVSLAARSLLIIGNNKVILVDTGNGTKFSGKQKEIFNLDNSKDTLERSLSRYGLTPHDVTDVILTHLHFDHCGGSTVKKEGKVIPAFPNASFYVQREQWENSQNPTERDRASFMQDDFNVLHEAGQMILVEGEKEIIPGIRTLVTYGHTMAQQLPVISDGITTLLFSCDLLPFTSHVPLPYIMGFDLRPLTTLEDKKRILPMAEQGKWIVFLEHDPVTEAITLQATEKGITVNQKMRIGE